MHDENMRKYIKNKTHYYSGMPWFHTHLMYLNVNYTICSLEFNLVLAYLYVVNCKNEYVFNYNELW